MAKMLANVPVWREPRMRRYMTESVDLNPVRVRYRTKLSEPEVQEINLDNEETVASIQVRKRSTAVCPTSQLMMIGLRMMSLSTLISLVNQEIGISVRATHSWMIHAFEYALGLDGI